ncbi:transmembrane protein 165-like isoform X2 [Amphibalanus amphitrite]|uniref:transmembrane protein 165-like isoform X2 n=1 Tax=Amphibalanus amphitrite TaxID=1232801 RepID=UPI001C912994|nr:transmembrane protein 165-like isoform X2 [Amphibalanus amphitrite]
MTAVLMIERLRMSRLAVLTAMLAMLALAQVASSQDDSEKHSAVVPEQEEELAAVSSSSATEKPKGSLDVSFTHGFVASLSVIIVSELGDKTFFIAAIMSMQHSRLTVFLGAVAALFTMTILSVLLGFSIQIIPRAYTYYISSALFAVFGLKMLYDGYHMGQNEAQEEFEEVQSDLRKREDERTKDSTDIESGVARRGSVFAFISRVFIEAFTLTFLAEWGDRSQIATILLGAREDAWGVTLGGCLGHALCTGLAVIGGRLISQRISARTVTLVGGVVFLIFAVSALFISPES